MGRPRLAQAGLGVCPQTCIFSSLKIKVMANRGTQAVQGVKLLAWACLIGSTATSWYFLWDFIGGAGSLIVAVLLGIGVFAFQALIDFVGIGIILPAGAKTLGKAIVGGGMRKTVVLAGGGLFVMGLGAALFSGGTSWYGSQIAGSSLVAAFDVKQASVGVSEAEKARTAALRPHQARLDSLAQAKTAAVAAALGKRMGELYQSGNAWAVGKVQADPQAAKALAALDKQIQAANASLAKTEQATAPAFAKMAEVAAADLSLKADAHAARAEGSFYLWRFLGLGCVLISLVCQGIIVLREIANETKPRSSRKAKQRENEDLAVALDGGDAQRTGTGGAGNAQGGGVKNPKNMPLHMGGMNGTDPF